MPGRDKRGRASVKPQPRFQRRAVETAGAAQMVERRGARAIHAPRLLAHGDHAQASSLRGSEVDVREFGEGVAHLVVDGALAYLSAFNVRNGNAQRQRRPRPAPASRSGRRSAAADQAATRVSASASPRMATPIVFAMPVSVSELSRHSMRAWMGKPSRSISSRCCQTVATDADRERRRPVRSQDAAASSRSGQ